MAGRRIDAWRASGGELRAHPCGGWKSCATRSWPARPRVLEIRQELERQWGSIPGSERAGIPVRLVGAGGVGEWRARCRTARPGG
jgi:hypothetical protein